MISIYFIFIYVISINISLVCTIKGIIKSNQNTNTKHHKMHAVHQHYIPAKSTSLVIAISGAGTGTGGDDDGSSTKLRGRDHTPPRA
jgi:hypothetical protein